MEAIMEQNRSDQGGYSSFRFLWNIRNNVVNAGILTVIMLLTTILSAHAQSRVPVVVPLDDYENDILDSGGKLLADQAAINIHHYDLDLFIEPADSFIYGSVITHAHVLENTNRFVMHLDTVFTVNRVLHILMETQPMPLDFVHKDGLIIAELPEPLQEGEEVIIEISYFGQPRPAPNPPWEGGFTWSETDSGEPWIGVACQNNGADVWWPVKDHPSDRADSISLKFTVPADVKAVSNGLLRSVEQFTDDTRTFHWFTNYPINNYGVTVNIGPYVLLEQTYESVTGDEFPIKFWALPENRHKAEELMPRIFSQMEFFEEMLGPYPFRQEKYGVVESPFFGMEHQTLIAYGAGYKDDTVFDTGSGFDDLHHHELAHEWWGNMITIYDWKDFWIHEGFATYMQPLYAEQLHDKQQYRYFMKRLHERILNNMAVAPETSRSIREMYDGRDIYMKGAWILHTLRKLIGDDDFFKSLRKMTAQDPEDQLSVSDTPSRFVDTRDYRELVSSITGRDMDWFFNTYLHHKELPVLEKRWVGDRLYLSWSTPSKESFPMPIEVYDGRERIVVIPDGEQDVMIHDRDSFRIDPDDRVLREGMHE